MRKKLVKVAIIIAVILPVLAGYFLVKYLWLEPFDPAKFGIKVSENTKRPNEDNKAYLTRLMKKCDLQVYAEDFYVNSDSQLIGKISSIEFEDNKIKLGVGGKSVFNLDNNLVAAKSLQRLDDKNKLLNEMSLNEFSAKEIMEVLIPGNWIRMDKGPNGPATLIVYCHE
ncbi:hypothetical protein HZB78_05000 [Candidatus Collierbacteria bacterium]|nr:hypothetical protein [Candidatus Collierbacteria bacterium]